MPFRIALSGLHAATTDLKVTGNNIGNSETVGFKKSRAEFVDVYASAYGAISNVTTGSGTRAATIRQMFSQGNIEFTDNSTDLAITGQGFFVVEDDKGRYLSRNGAFGIDREGFATNSSGQKLQVFPPLKSGNQVTYNTGTLEDLQLNTAVGAPIPSTKIGINVNADAAVSPIFDVSTSTTPNNIHDHSIGPIPFDKSDPTTYNHVTATTIYDSLGDDHVTQMYFRKVDDGTALTNTWQVITYVDGNEIPPSNNNIAGGAAVAAPPLTGQAAVLQFNNDGTLKNALHDGLVPPAAGNFTLGYSPIVPTSGAANLDITIDFRRTTQYGAEFSVNELSQDGFTTGRLTGFDVEEDGVVFARYTNGNSEILGMVAVANVANPEALAQNGDSLWVETFGAGDTILGQPGTASLGLIQSGALESSTVEVADELVNMIISQRNYQANAQVISTADQLTQTLLNIR